LFEEKTVGIYGTSARVAERADESVAIAAVDLVKVYGEG
jgi:hypothetical protein